MTIPTGPNDPKNVAKIQAQQNMPDPVKPKGAPGNGGSRGNVGGGAPKYTGPDGGPIHFGLPGHGHEGERL